MRSAPRREALGGGGQRRARDPARRAPEHPILHLQRSAGNAAVSKLLRAGGGDTATEDPPKPSVADFLNSFTPLFRGLLAKFEGGEQLDRIDIDTLRELRADARGRGLRNLVADCDDLLARARGRGVVTAPEEVAPPEPEPRELTEGEKAVIAGIATALIKDRIQRNAEKRDNLRGGRAFASVGGVQYVHYEVADLLFTAAEAQRIEALIRAAAEQDIPAPPDAAELWQTVVILCKQGTPVSEVIELLEIYATPPTIGEWFGAWFANALKAPESQGPVHGPEEEPVPQTVKLPHDLGVLLRKQLIQKRAQTMSLEYSRPMRELERLNRELKKLLRLYERYNTSPAAQFAKEELQAFIQALKELRVLANSIKTLFEAGDTPNLLAFDVTLIEAAVPAAHRAEAKLRSVIVEIEANMGLGSSAAQSAKKFKKTEKDTESTGPRKGGADGVWDKGFDATEMVSWVDGLTTRAIEEKNIKSCVAYIEVFKGSGGGTSTTYNNLPVFHISHGLMGSKDGCTLFFTQTADGTITIVALGSHDNRYTTAYKIDWQAPGAWQGGTWDGNTLILKK